jgi:vacuolar-type H+-ATPase subunit E/Vma4
VIYGSSASVIASIRDEASAEVERLEKSAAGEVARLRQEAATTSVAITDRDIRIAAARRAVAERLAQEEWESRRAIIEQREAWITQVVARGREILLELPASDALVNEARAQLPPGHAVVTPAEGGGCIVSCGDVLFDNSYESRARRLEPEWRKALSEVYRV